jgi:hypothetical protein
MTAETQRIKGEILVQFPFQLLNLNGAEVDRYGTMKDAVRGAEGLADGWKIILQEHLFAVIPGYWGIGEEQMCGVCGLVKSQHDAFVPQEILQDPVPFPKVQLPQDPWRQLYPLAVCPHCSAYVHDEAVHRKKCP